MKDGNRKWFEVRLLISGVLLSLLCQSALADVATWKGQTPDVKLAGDAEVRLSVLGFTEAGKAKALAGQYQQYLDSHNEEAFAAFLQREETRGYLFTREAVGYTIKYAWQSGDESNKHMVLLLTPALKTRNPYQWKQPNKGPASFTLVEVKLAGDEALMSTSLDTPIGINAQGQLQLQTSDKSSVFARLKDDTPYYLKGKS